MLLTSAWILLAAATVLAAGAAVLAGRHERRSASLLATVLLTGGLLWWLGADIAVLVWLGPGVALARLVASARSATPASRGNGLPALATALPGLALGLLLVTVVVQVDWRPLPPPEPVALGAEFGGRLVTEDAVLWLGSALLLVLALVVMAWNLRSGRSAEDEPS